MLPSNARVEEGALLTKTRSERAAALAVSNASGESERSALDPGVSGPYLSRPNNERVRNAISRCPTVSGKLRLF